MITGKLIYRNYIIESGGLGYTYVHKDYEGVTFLGEDIESKDPRCGSRESIEACKEEIDEIEEDMEEKSLIKVTGLDPSAPYCLGNKTYFYERKCNSGHKNLSDDEIGFSGGMYDGYHWCVPVCMRCISTQEDRRVSLYSHYLPFHLKEHIPNPS